MISGAGGSITQRAVRPDGVVVDAPLLDDHLCFSQRVEDLSVERFFVQRMKSKWGSCNYKARTIRLNTELAKKPSECLEYVVVHEMTHLLEPTHNARFTGLLDRFIPQWQQYRDILNRLPVRHEHWGYRDDEGSRIDPTLTPPLS